jgi:hypothetical protein
MGTVASSHQERGEAIINASTRIRATHVGLLILAAFGIIIAWWFLHTPRADAMSNELVLSRGSVRAVRLADATDDVSIPVASPDTQSPPGAGSDAPSADTEPTATPPVPATTPSSPAPEPGGGPATLPVDPAPVDPVLGGGAPPPSSSGPVAGAPPASDPGPTSSNDGVTTGCVAAPDAPAPAAARQATDCAALVGTSSNADAPSAAVEAPPAEVAPVLAPDTPPILIPFEVGASSYVSLGHGDAELTETSSVGGGGGGGGGSSGAASTSAPPQQPGTPPGVPRPEGQQPVAFPGVMSSTGGLQQHTDNDHTVPATLTPTPPVGAVLRQRLHLQGESYSNANLDDRTARPD